MRGSQIRQTFLKYFERNGHTIVPSSPLIPQNDPTLLFVNSGMVQFKDCFLGADKRAYTRATTCQKSLRISGKHNDLENVGMTARHHTFFEMLGNFSFGDYFKAEAIKYAWELITKELGIPKSHLWVTIYEKDDEAGKLWRDLTDLLPGRIIKLGEKDNFWAMGDVGPCGPCTEIHVYRGEDPNAQSEELFRREDGSFLEIYNLVFMQYNRSADGKLNPLPKPAVDTGMGLERVASVINNFPANYDTDLLRDIISTCENLSGFKYDGRSYVERDLRKDLNYARDVAMRVIADHSRAMTFLVAEGVQPGSEGRNYVLRRLIRRAIRHSRVLSFKEPFLAKTTDTVIKIMSDQYPELIEQRDFIKRVVDAEEKKFLETLDQGLSVLQKEVEKLSPHALFPGKAAFVLHDTYGFPLDLTEDALKGYGRRVDTDSFNKEMDAQRTRSREDRKSQKLIYTSVSINAPKTEFIGYAEKEAESVLEQVIKTDGGVSLVFNATPFYAESGGQVGDVGTIDFKDAKLKVIDTQKVQDKYFVHECEVVAGEITEKMKGQKAHMLIDVERRAKIRANHSATHLVHAALRKVLGTHVKQAGSRVDDRSLRFDYSHFEPVTQAQLRDIESFVNEEIRSNHEVSTRIMPIDEARKTGAMALFGEKYGDMVRVVQIGPRSVELCGGTHVGRSGDIGFLMPAYETGIAAGTRRIECWSGSGAEIELWRERQERSRIADLLNCDPAEISSKVERAVSRSKQLEKEIETLKSKLAQTQSGDLASQVKTTPKGVKVIAQTVDGADTDTLRSMVDKLRVKIGSGVVILAGVQGDSSILVAGVTADLTPGIHAGNLVKEAVKVGGGKGGGRPDFAQAGGVPTAVLNATLEKVIQLIS